MAEHPFNYALSLPSDVARLPDYEVIRCWEEGEVFWAKDRLCVLATRRPCKPVHPEYEMNRQMVEHGW